MGVGEMGEDTNFQLEKKSERCNIQHCGYTLKNYIAYLEVAKRILKVVIIREKNV